MKKVILILLAGVCLLWNVAFSQSGNIGIGTVTPQRKLHVAGGMRIDTLAGAGNGFIRFNSNGDIIRFTETNNVSDVLRGNGTWGPAIGTVPQGSVVATYNYNDANLISKGFSLIGEIPGIVTRYATYSMTFPAASWVPTYTRGVVTKQSAPYLYGVPPSAWTGSRMYAQVWDQLNAYDPLTDEWTLVSTNTTSVDLLMNGRKAVWTGTEFIIWGGYYSPATNNGVRYNPSTNTWNTIATLNQPSAREDFTMIWTGSRILVWGGRTLGSAVLGDGAMYDPVTNTWTSINMAGAPSPRTGHTGVWNSSGNRMIIWGGSSTVNGFAGEQLITGALFNPSTNTWTGVTNPVGTPPARWHHTGEWTGTEMIVFGGEDNYVTLNTGGRYNPSTNTWAGTATSGAPFCFSHAATWTGSVMLVTGGMRRVGTSILDNIATGYTYNPTTNTWSYAGNFGNNRYDHFSFLTGGMVLIFGGLHQSFDLQTGNSGVGPTNTGSRYLLSSTVVPVTELIKGMTLYLYNKN